MEEYRVNGMSCAACVAHVEKAVKKLPGVSDVNVSLLTNSMSVEGDVDTAAIVKAVSSAGYEAVPRSSKAAPDSSALGREKLKNTELPRLLSRLFFSLVMLCPLMYLSMGHMMWGWPILGILHDNPVGVGIIEMLLAILVMYTNQSFFVSGLKSVLHGAPNMDTLVAMGSGVSFGYSVYSLVSMTDAQGRGDAFEFAMHAGQLYFESAAMIVTLITIGKVLESYSKGRTTDALKGLMDLAPKTAVVIREGKELEVPVDRLRKGDDFIVRPGGAIPVDGIVISGEAAIDASAMTGESIPVDVKKGDEVLGGTINTTGFITCRVIRTGENTALAQIIRLVSDASATKAPIARAADRVAAIFVPAVIAVACITCAVWIALGQSLDFAVTHAIAVLVISCPCALGLATPVAIMVGNGVGAKNGILFKTAAALENAGNAKVVVLDKTGTITRGEPRVTDVIPNQTISVPDLLAAGGMLESKSEHPIASAIMYHIKENRAEYPEAEQFISVSGSGVKAYYNGSYYYAGSQAYIYETLQHTDGEDDFISYVRTWSPELYEKKGKSAVFFARDDKLLGSLMVADTLREESVQAIKNLKILGLRVVMLTGDNERTATYIGNLAGVEAVIAGVLPQTKEKIVRKLKRRAGNVLMVGDGINDAPALTAADTGFAIGAGTDIAMDAADVVLTQSRLTDVSGALVLSRGVKRNIYENLFWAFFYNIIGIPLAAGVWYPLFGVSLSPMFGAAAMSLSSFCVVMNALRLNFIKLDNVRHYRRKRSGESISKLMSSSRKRTADDQSQTIKEAGVVLNKEMKIEGMMCAHCEARVKDALEKVSGVESAAVSHEKGNAVLIISGQVSDESLTQAVTDAGYEVKAIV